MNGANFARRGGIRRTRGTAAVLAALLLAPLWLLSACDDDRIAGGSSSTETGNEISLTGRVIGNTHEPLSGVVVALAGDGATDTTGPDGRYFLVRKLAPDRSGPVLDTLIFARDGQRITALEVTHWIDTLPDLLVVQRGISGMLDADTVHVTRVEAVVTGDDIPPATPIVAEFFYNAPSGNYSGFVYFPPSSSTQAYTVTINVYGTGGVLTGRSPTVPFNSLAGNVTVPRFAADNLVSDSAGLGKTPAASLHRVFVKTVP